MTTPTINSRIVVTKQIKTAKISPREEGSNISIGDAGGKILFQGESNLETVTIPVRTFQLANEPTFTFNPAITFNFEYYQIGDEVTLTIRDFGGTVNAGLNNRVQFYLPNSIFSGTTEPNPSKIQIAPLFMQFTSGSGPVITRVWIVYNEVLHPEPKSYLLQFYPDASYTNGQIIDPVDLTFKFRLLY